MDAASFRDPGGRVTLRDGRVFREVNPAGLICLDAALESPAIQREIEAGRFVKTQIVSRNDSSATLEHEAVPFPSFPYEWPPEMLYEAGALTLDLALDLAAEGRGLKDATPFNILYRGTQPVFVDVLSIERREPLDPLWLPRAQFIRTFVLPLAASRNFGIPVAQTLLQREGIEPEEFYRLLPALARIQPRYLSLVSMPVWLGEKSRGKSVRQSSGKQGPPGSPEKSLYQPHLVKDPDQAAYILRGTLRATRKSLDRFSPSARESRWTGYMAADCSYTPEQFAEKEAFVAQVLRDFAAHFPNGRVLDAGANTGHFSAIAARSSGNKISVVAIDSDPAVAGQIYRRARAENLDILPLVVNLAHPTPATGWRNRECPSFLERAGLERVGAASGKPKFDLVMMLAVIHHMLATERVPLDEILALAADLTTRFALIEFVDCEDAMFRSLSRGRDALYAHLHADLFERFAANRFEIVRQHAIKGSKRTLYLLEKKSNI